MIISKDYAGLQVKVEYEKIQVYRRFTLYQVYRVIGDKKIPIYKTTLPNDERVTGDADE